MSARTPSAGWLGRGIGLVFILVLAGCATPIPPFGAPPPPVQLQDPSMAVSEANEAIQERDRREQARVGSLGSQSRSANPPRVSPVVPAERLGEAPANAGRLSLEPAIRLHFIGFAQRLLAASAAQSRDADGAAMLAIIASPEMRAEIERVGTQFCQGAAATPGSRIEIVPKGASIAAEAEIRKAAFVAIAFDPDDIVVLRESYVPGQQVRRIFFSLPLVVVDARTHTLLHAQPVWIDVLIPHGVSLTDPKAGEIIRATVAGAFTDPVVADPNRARMVAALARGTFRDPNRPSYSVRHEDMRIVAEGGIAEAGMVDSTVMARLIRGGIENYLARKEVIVPSLGAKPTSQQQQELGIAGYGLVVITDLAPHAGLPQARSGRYILPVHMPEPDFRLACTVNGNAMFDPPANKFFRTGAHAIILNVTRANSIGEEQGRKRILGQGSFSLPEGVTLRPKFLESVLTMLPSFANGFSALGESKPVSLSR
jgi:hypothetical protein